MFVLDCRRRINSKGSDGEEVGASFGATNNMPWLSRILSGWWWAPPRAPPPPPEQSLCREWARVEWKRVCWRLLQVVAVWARVFSKADSKLMNIPKKSFLQ